MTSYNTSTLNELRAGDWVEVLSKEEILKTLDKNGQLDELPFMPEMFAFCGKRFRVYKRAHKTCDTVNDYKGRKMNSTVHLEGLRCNGDAHGGCQAGCLIFWKIAWLKPVAGPTSHSAPARSIDNSFGGCTEADVIAATLRPRLDEGGGPAYRCQATQVPAATARLSPWELGQYVEDYRSGNATLWKIVKGFIYMAYRHWIINLGIGIGPAARWFYDVLQRIWGGIPYPRRHGKIPAGKKTPTVDLNLQEGEWVRVKDLHSILATLDEDDKNRGMKWDAELVPYCGGTYKVISRVNQILDEKTGKMLKMKTPCILLEGVVCQARYSECRLFCPRSVYLYWREIWLERIETSDRRASIPVVNKPSIEKQRAALTAARTTLL